MKMGKDGGRATSLLETLAGFMRKCLFRILSIGPVPNHIAFIMDGNRRYSKKKNLEGGAGHEAGYSALMSMLKYSYELGVKYLTVYAFSIDNFKRQPEEVHSLMNLMLEKIEKLLEKESIMNQYNIRVYFIGNLKLMSEPVRIAAEKAMKASANNTKYVLLICVAYTSCDEIVHAVQNSCHDKMDEILALKASKGCNGEILEENEKINGNFLHDIQEPCDESCNGVVASELIENEKGKSCTQNWDEIEASNTSKSCNGGLVDEESEIQPGKRPAIKLVDIEKHMYMRVAPDPDILIRTSGETRLSNFLLWQTDNCPLYSPAALWPEIGLRHFIWAVLNFQRSHSYLEKKKKLS